MLTTTDHNAETLRQARAEMQRAARGQTIAEERGAMLERAADLALEGLWEQSKFVAKQFEEAV